MMAKQVELDPIMVHGPWDGADKIFWRRWARVWLKLGVGIIAPGEIWPLI